jgi:hypothetical protein
MRRHILSSVVMLAVLTVVLGFGYPLVVTGVSALAFDHQAKGSLVYRNGRLVGSSLLGQNFTNSSGAPLPHYFQPRPSAAGAGYDGTASGATNLGPSNPLLIGFVAGVNTVGLDGRRSPTNPFATKADPACVPVNLKGGPVASRHRASATPVAPAALTSVTRPRSPNAPLLTGCSTGWHRTPPFPSTP